MKQYVLFSLILWISVTRCKSDTETKLTPACTLNCHSGHCTLTASGPRCVCDPLYTGPHCEHYRCSQFCRNKGMCYVDLLSTRATDSNPPLKCNCPPQWTGERCETPVHVCEGRCYNNGTCYSPLPGVPQCNCEPGYTGARCENCLNLACQNGGVCGKDANGKETCKCTTGYSGPHCQLSECDGYCNNKGTCTLTSFGPQCVCQVGFSGKKCEVDSCSDICQNGGSCKPGKQVECVCPALFSGRRCEVSLCLQEPKPKECYTFCNGTVCQNDGQCVLLDGREVCKCSRTYGGVHCEVYLGNDNPCTGYCEHGGVCQIASLTGKPLCFCTGDWAGTRCTIKPECINKCMNGGTCSVTDGIPYCSCASGYEGINCDKPVLRTAEATGEAKSGSVVTGLLIFFGLLALIVAGLAIGYVTLKRRRIGKSFTHERLDDNNLEISNPMYMNGEVEDDGDPLERSFTLDQDKGTNFANPVYDTMYNNSTVGANCSRNEEKAVLLEHTNEESPPTGPDEL